MSTLQALAAGMIVLGTVVLGWFLEAYGRRSAARARLRASRGRARRPSVRTVPPDFPSAPAAPPIAPTAREARGAAGEALVRDALSRCGFYAMHDVTIPSAGGRTTQVDHIVLAGRSLVCLETKNWAGTIAGGHADEFWTQTVGGRGVQNRYDNPVRQNEWHEKWLGENVRDAFADIGCTVRGFVVMADPTAILSLPDKRKVTDVAGLPGCLGTVERMDQDGNEARRWARLQAVASDRGWSVGEVTLRRAPCGDRISSLA